MTVTNDVFDSGDVVIVAPDVGRVIVVHHNGLITTPEGKAAGW